MRRVLLITNADAGSSDRDSVQTAVATMQSAGLGVDVTATSDPAELDDVLAPGPAEVVVAGGDGSLHAVVAVLHRRGLLAQTTVGLVPLGTGNDFARGAGIPLDPEGAAQVVAGGRARGVDLLVDDEGGVVVNAVHAGVGADAGREAQPWKSRLGRLGYVVGAVLAGIKTSGHRLRVVADGEVVADGHRRVLQVGLGNAGYVGGGTPLSPDALPHDAKVDLVVSFAVTPLARLRYAARLRRGTHGERSDVATVRATTVEVEGEPFWCNADGELLGPYRRRRWEVQPAAVRMWLPDGTAEA
jgi:diacylglycerol kinase family enzyme